MSIHIQSALIYIYKFRFLIINVAYKYILIFYLTLEDIMLKNNKSRIYDF